MDYPYAKEQFTAAEADVLRPYFTSLDRPVFALVNLPEVVKGALFARYSRSPKSLRRPARFLSLIAPAKKYPVITWMTHLSRGDIAFQLEISECVLQPGGLSESSRRSKRREDLRSDD